MMSRKLLINIHLYLAAFFAPFVFLVAISGGLYLAGVKGEVIQESIYSGPANALDPSAASLRSDIAALLKTAGVDNYHFEYVKVKGNTLYTRPTSRTHYVIKLQWQQVEVVHAAPSLQSRMVELHKGHGPTAFKTFQKVFAIGLLFIVGSGLWLGLSAAGLRRRTLLTTLAGSALFLVLVLG
jgi:hypothetical protein